MEEMRNGVDGQCSHEVDREPRPQIINGDLSGIGDDPAILVDKRRSEREGDIWKQTTYESNAVTLPWNNAVA